MLEIEIFSDVICPWCFVGKRRLERTLLGAQPQTSLDDTSLVDTQLGEGVRLRYRPFLLYPRTPKQGVDRGEFLRRRYGGSSQARGLPENLRHEAQVEGITLRYDLIKFHPSTRAAHRLLEWCAGYNDDAHPLGVQSVALEGLFQAYFCEGRDIGDVSELVSLAAAMALPVQGLAERLHEDVELDAEIGAQLQRADDLGVTGVPGYLFGGSYLLPGAQSLKTRPQLSSGRKSGSALSGSFNHRADLNTGKGFQ